MDIFYWAFFAEKLANYIVRLLYRSFTRVTNLQKVVNCQPGSWSNSNAFVSGAEVQISGRAVTFIQQLLYNTKAQWRGNGLGKLVTRTVSLQQVQ